MIQSEGRSHGFAVNSSDLILAEFNYITNTAYQSNEDRSRTFQFYYLVFGTFLGSFLASTQTSNVTILDLNLVFAILFAFNTLVGFVTTYQLARLRLSWLEAIRAMNQIKNTVMHERPELAPYFRWRNQTAPPAFNPRSVSLGMALLTTLLGGITAGAAVSFAFLGLGAEGPNWGISVFTALAVFVLSFALGYWRPLSSMTAEDDTHPELDKSQTNSKTAPPRPDEAVD